MTLIIVVTIGIYYIIIFSISYHQLQVLKESLRMYPAATGIVKAVAPGGVTLSGYHVPAQTQLIVRKRF